LRGSFLVAQGSSAVVEPAALRGSDLRSRFARDRAVITL
jgi:hypothetical protein